MANLRILAENLWDQAELTASSQAMPVDYTQRSERPFVWRSTSAQSQTLTATLPAAAYLDCIALARHNLGGLGLWRIELLLADQVVYDSSTVSTGMLIPAGVFRAGIDAWGATYNDRLPNTSSLGIHWLPGPLAADTFRLTLMSEGVDYLEVGRVFAGLSWSPQYNLNWSPQVEWQEDAEHAMTEGGSLRTVGSGRLRRHFALQLDWLNASDRQMLVTDLARMGMRADLLVALYPDEEGLNALEHTMVCRRDATISHTHNMLRNWQTSLSFLEV
ncbi:hypothetical protein BFW38_03390 [Terasakiispira papahanaumokuakeensis]|uniref:Uncharacterized protein n=1 Tax=Terasakiispira papahanaumokuakeensis TaxID=197479 RepID=A0A1E2V6W9_9GAMM|nr:hypothetical protein [Terasakiispira papahanaumokuakeensis]ODC02731.1 hypothetical protein BFW38_03390 [Terasakiispira papahanaumokuakeensis]